MSIKNSTLRRRTKELTECADDAREYQLFGYELKELGSLIVSMAIHMGNLQRKIDSQVKHIKDLNEKLIDRKTEPQTNADQHIQHVESVEQTEAWQEPFETDCSWK